MINDELGIEELEINETNIEEKFNNSSSIYINKITLDCLMSKKQRNKLGQDIFSIKYDKKDKKFYRRRIINLTREMLLNNNIEDILLDVKETFDAYVKACIGFFKVKDETDIIQADMNLNELCFLEEITKDDKILDKDDIVTPEEANKLMMKTIKINKLPLDNFVTIKNLKISKEEPILPKQKDINLKDPILKNKGIRKKKNVDNQYIENENKNKE